MNRSIVHFVTMFALACANVASAQTTTEAFEGLSANSTQFTSNGVTFDIVSNAAPVFDIYDSGVNLYGWNGSAKDSKFIDNTRSASDGGYWGVLPNFSIKKHGSSDPNFQVGSFWLYPALFNLTSLGSGGSVTVTGKLAGSTVFTASASSGFNTSTAVTNGFSKIDLTTFGGANNASKTIDEIQIVTGGNFQYLALDALTWTKVAGYTISTAVTPAGAGTLTCTPNPVSPGGTATCTAAPGANYELSTISGCGGTTTNPSLTTGTINAACTVTAAFVPRLDAYISFTTNVSCHFGSNGVAGVAVAAGTGVSPYSYSWSPSGGTNATATGLAANTYTVTVTDARSISVQRQATITQPLAALLLGTTSIADGVVGAAYSQAFSASGGTPGYSYGQTSGSVPGLSFSGANLSGTPATTGSYNIGVMVQDANGCADTKNYPMQVRATVGGNATGLAASSFLLLANGSDTVTVSASGAFAFPTPQAQGATYHVTVAAQPSSPPQQCTVTGSDGTIGSGNVTSVAVDCKRLYTVSTAVSPAASGTLSCSSVQVASGSTTSCTATPAAGFLLDHISGCGGVESQTSPFTTGPVTGDCTVTASYVPALAASISQTFQPSCDGGSNGSVTVTPAGGFAPYTYSWSPGGLIGNTTATVSGLPAGAYTATVTDNRNNQVTASATLTYPPALVLGSETAPDGINGVAYTQTFTASGGSPPLTFSVTNGAAPDGVTISTDGILSGTPTTSGTFAFKVGVVDAHSCGPYAGAQNTVHIRSTIGGTVSGLAAGTNLTLANGADTITVGADGAFTFPTPVDSGSAYGVTVQNMVATPPQLCGVASGTGTVGTANVADVTVSCAAGLALGINDDADYASYGESLDYVVGVHNPTSVDASGVQVSATLSAAFDAGANNWQCLSNGSNGVVCNAGPVSGVLADTATVPAGQTALWALHAQIDPTTPLGVAVIDVAATYAAPWSDTNTLVIFRNGFDEVAPVVQTLPPSRVEAVMNGSALATFTPAAASGRLIDAVLALPLANGVIRVQRLNAASAPWLRLQWLDGGHARTGAWQRAGESAPLGIGGAVGAEGRVILLEGEGLSTQLALPHE